jgi:REP element-mobilizing transposase RayT
MDMEKFRGKYRIESNRLRGWNYSSNGLYFITIVTAGREGVFGHIKNDKMILYDFGKIAHDEWHTSFEIRQELFLDEFILMPNHLHAIVVLNNDFGDDKMNIMDNERSNGENAGRIVETHGRASLQYANHANTPTFQRKPKSISSFVAGYKSAVLNKIDDYIDDNNLNIPKYNRNNPLWQPNYHDHIIRDDVSYQRIKNYIINNPKQWKDDKFYNFDN